MHRPFRLSEASVPLPRGTRVVLRVDCRGDDGFIHRAGTLGTVRELTYDTYVLETPGGRFLQVQRDQITLQRQDLLAQLGRRAWSFRQLRDEVIYAAVVGSQAWGLAGPDSDEDIRGCFVAPFDAASGLWDCPDEIQNPAGEDAYWEVEKLLYQGLRGDANTLETLWSPLHKVVTPLGQVLLERRRMFVSMNILGSFGRYAQSQFQKIQRSLTRDRALTELLTTVHTGEIGTREQAAAFLARAMHISRAQEAANELKACVRSVFDRGLLPEASFEALLQAVRTGREEELRPPPHRPKNAYNLLRLLHSCLTWLTTREPMIVVPADLRPTLLDIKHGRTPIERTLELAQALAAEVDERAHDARLPAQPDYEAADDFLRLCRREQARRQLRPTPTSLPPDAAAQPESRAGIALFQPSWFPDPLPSDVDLESVRRFLGQRLPADGPMTLLWIGLTGAHAYGFPSPDSDLDLKAVHVADARAVLGVGPGPSPLEHLRVFEGREMDFSSHDLGQVVQLLLRGNGNMLERLLGPLNLVTTPAGHTLRHLSRQSLSRRVFYHYRGFFAGMRREYEREAADGMRTAKRLLYAYRAALTGIHALLAGEIETRVDVLAEHYQVPGVDALIQVKQRAERQTLGEAEATPHLEALNRLERRLEEARERSILPEAPSNQEALEQFVVEMRRHRLCEGE
jgi:predicted nucleotidyltransferase